MKYALWIGFTLALLGGCNTVEGVGRDISGGANVVRGWFGS